MVFPLTIFSDFPTSEAVRKLATFSLGFCSAVFAAQYLIPVGVRLYFSVALGLLAGFTQFLCGKARKRVFIVFLSAFFGMFWSWGHYLLYIAPGDAIDGESSRVVATAIEYSEHYDSYSRVYAVCKGEGIPEVKTLVYDYNGDLPKLSPGDTFSAQISFSASSYSRGEQTDYFISRGVYLRGYIVGETELLGSENSLRFLPQRAAHFLSARADMIFTEDTAAFFKAILIGDKTDFNSNRQLYNETANAGLLHVCAVSGMHAAFVISLLTVLTGRTRLCAFIGVPLVFAYALIAGATPSVIRAAVMQSFLLLAPIMRRENDTITSLSAALLLLLIHNPAACASASLQLSFAAILGIALLTPKCYNYIMSTRPAVFLSGKKLTRRICSAAAAAVSCSVGALSFTVPLVAAHFGTVAHYSILTNLLTLWVVSLIFGTGMVVLILGCVWIAGAKAAALMLAIPARYIFFVVHIISGLPYSVLYMRGGDAALWLVCSYFIFVLTYVFKRKTGFRPILPICLSLCSLCVLLVFGHGRAKAAVLDVGQGLCTAVSVGETAVVIDCGSAYGGDEAGETCAQFLFSEGQWDVDLLALTHLHSDHCNGVVELFSHMNIKMLALPSNSQDTDSELEDILACCREQETEVVYIDDASLFQNGVLTLEAQVFDIGSSENEAGAVYLLSALGFDILVTGDAGIKTETAAASAFNVDVLELLVVGHHGSETSTGGALLSAFKPRFAAISVGTGNSYGHPADSTLSRLAAYCGDIYRTDKAGDIIFLLE